MRVRRIAVLIDGGFFLKRLPKLVPAQFCTTPKQVADTARHLCKRHVQRLVHLDTDQDAEGFWLDHVYRLFYYDATPYDALLRPAPSAPLDEACRHELHEFVATMRNICEHDVNFGLRQKGVDMRIGLDIASMTLKCQVDTLILVTGDSDFVPAAKLARREGVEFILDPLWQQVSDDLSEHVDGVVSVFPRHVSDSQVLIAA
jgi:uncharacterized LabA/DUF88 family protein